MDRSLHLCSKEEDMNTVTVEQETLFWLLQHSARTPIIVTR